MANEEHLDIVKQGVEAWNRWREENPTCELDLHGADLHGADLRGANLSGVRLHGADLSVADLRAAILSEANLRGADLFGAHLREADLAWANLDEADLRGADLYSAYLSRAHLSGARLFGANLSQAHLVGADLSYASISVVDLSGADLSEATVSHSRFEDVDLSTAKGIETIKHLGPSTIGIDTIYRSHGKIPPQFLRDAGVPEVFITNMKSLVAMAPFEYYSCFISCSFADEAFAKRLHSRLRDAGVRVWFASEDIQGGEKVYDQLEKAIQVHDRLLLVLSEHSMTSQWVLTELRRALAAEAKDQRRKLFPIRLCDMASLKQWSRIDADTGKDMAVEVREYFIPDFSDWKNHDSFEAAFQRLIRDLRATAARDRRS